MVAQLDSEYATVGGSRTARLASWALFEGRPLTTRGRFWNPVVLAWHKMHRHLPALASVERPIFVMGMGRSGTTLLARLLSVHPRVAFLNEPKALWHVAVGREDVTGSYDRRPARYRLGAEDAEDTVELRRLYGACLFWTRRDRLLDKSPEVVYRVPFVRALFPDARFLLAIRDGREVCRSVERWSRQNGRSHRGEVHDWWGADRRKWNLLLDQVAADEPDLSPELSGMRRWSDQRAMAALEWVLAMRYGERAERAHTDAVLCVRYEHLLESPEATLSGVLRWCGLESEEPVLEYARRVVAPPPRGGGFDLPPSIVAPFEATLERLGYLE